MTTAPDAPSSPPAHGPGSPQRDRLRAAVYGTLMAMSVLAYLGDHEPVAVVAGLTVAGTGIVIFLAEAYSGLLAGTLTGPPRSGRHVLPAVLGETLGTAVPGVAAGLLLAVLSLTGLDVSLRIDITLWTGVAALAVLSVLAGRAARRRAVLRAVWAVVSVLIGVGIVLLKAALH